MLCPGLRWAWGMQPFSSLVPASPQLAAGPQRPHVPRTYSRLSCSASSGSPGHTAAWLRRSCTRLPRQPVAQAGGRAAPSSPQLALQPPRTQPPPASPALPRRAPATARPAPCWGSSFPRHPIPSLRQTADCRGHNGLKKNSELVIPFFFLECFTLAAVYQNQ